MRTYTKPRWLKMGTPPEDSSSYGFDLLEGVVLRRTVDESDGSESWAISDLTRAEETLYAQWEPTDGAPTIEADFMEVDVTW